MKLRLGRVFWGTGMTYILGGVIMGFKLSPLTFTSPNEFILTVFGIFLVFLSGLVEW